MSKIIAVKYASEVKIVLPPPFLLLLLQTKSESKQKKSSQQEEEAAGAGAAAAGEDCSVASRESRLLFDSSLSQGDRELNSNSKNTK